MDMYFYVIDYLNIVIEFLIKLGVFYDFLKLGLDIFD